MREAYIAAIGWGLTRAEFWDMHPTELWWWLEAKMGVRMIGSLTLDEAEELCDYMQEQGIE